MKSKSSGLGIKFDDPANRKLGLLGVPMTAHASDEDISKLAQLCTYYGIPPVEGMFFQLALILARQLYPEKKQRGTKVKWLPWVKGVLVVEVDRRLGPNAERPEVKRVCNELARQNHWLSLLGKKSSHRSRQTTDVDANTESIRRQYYKAQGSEQAKASKEVYLTHKADGTVAQWDEYVTALAKYAVLPPDTPEELERKLSQTYALLFASNVVPVKPKAKKGRAGLKPMK